MQQEENLIFGHTWEAIQRAQQGGSLYDVVLPHHPAKPLATATDIDLLLEHGERGLEEKMWHGVLDRLRTSGVIGGLQK